MKIETINSDFDAIKIEFNEDESICTITVPKKAKWLNDGRFADEIKAISNENLIRNHICGDAESLRKINSRLRSFFHEFIKNNSPDIDAINTTNKLDFQKLVKAIDSVSELLLDICSNLKEISLEVRKLSND